MSGGGCDTQDCGLDNVPSSVVAGVDPISRTKCGTSLVFESRVIVIVLDEDEAEVVEEEEEIDSEAEAEGAIRICATCVCVCVCGGGATNVGAVSSVDAAGGG